MYKSSTVSNGIKPSIMDYNSIVEAAKERGLEFLADQDGWKKSNKSTDAFTIETKPSKKYSCNVVRMTINAKAPMKLCYDSIRLTPGTRRTEWDNDLKKIELIQNVDDNTVLFSVRTNSVGKGVISPREFVDVARAIVSDGSVYTYGCSVEHPALESDGSKYVRAINGSWYYKFIKDPSTENHTYIQCIVESDMKGWIPSALLNSTVPAVFSQALTHWADFLQKEIAK